jgi:hypothetical protein
VWIIFESNERLVDVLQLELICLFFAALLTEKQVALAIFVEIIANKPEKLMNTLSGEGSMLHEVKKVEAFDAFVMHEHVKWAD